MQANAEGQALVTRARERVETEGVTRPVLEKVLAELKALAARSELWTAEHYPDPRPDEQQSRYLIHEDAGNTYALYLNVMRPGKKIPPHNHTTWACIAAVEGAEHNTLYSRVDGGAGAGEAELKVDGVVVIEPGAGVALMPDDIHAVEIKGDRIIRHLHFYGRSLETLSERLTFDPETKTAKVMDIGVTTKR